MNQNNLTKALMVAALVLLVAVLGYLVLVKNTTPRPMPSPSPVSTNEPKPNAPTTTPTAPTTTITPNYEAQLNLSDKEPDTKVYISDKLGVGFTYSPVTQEGGGVLVTEGGNTIYVHYASERPDQGQSIEVFDKDPKATLAEAVKERFLKGLDPKECFVKTYPASQVEQKLPNYVAAGISYPQTTDSDEPAFAVNAAKCSLHYSETNGVQYFLMNKDVPSKFIFVRVGQYSLTSDGIPPEGEVYPFNWTHSIRILK